MWRSRRSLLADNQRLTRERDQARTEAARATTELLLLEQTSAVLRKQLGHVLMSSPSAADRAMPETKP